MVWFRLASHLHMTVQECQATITSTEFIKWRWYLDWRDTKEFHQEYYYLAQIAATIDRGQVKHPKKIKVKDYILNFSPNATPKQEEQVQKSKNFWKAFTGLAGNKKRAVKKRLPKRKKKKKNKE